MSEKRPRPTKEKKGSTASEVPPEFTVVIDTILSKEDADRLRNKLLVAKNSLDVALSPKKGKKTASEIDALLLGYRQKLNLIRTEFASSLRKILPEDKVGSFTSKFNVAADSHVKNLEQSRIPQEPTPAKTGGADAEAAPDAVSSDAVVVTSPDTIVVADPAVAQAAEVGRAGRRAARAHA